MSTIPSNLTSADLARQSLGRSLVDLSSRARPATSELPGEDESSSDLRLQAYRQVANENRFAALNTSEEAGAANQSAVTGIATQPDSALITQANTPPDAAWGLLQQD